RLEQRQVHLHHEHVLGEERLQTLAGLAPAAPVQLRRADGRVRGLLDRGLQLPALDHQLRAEPGDPLEPVQVLAERDLLDDGVTVDRLHLTGLWVGLVQASLDDRLRDSLMDQLLRPVAELRADPRLGDVRVGRDTSGDPGHADRDLVLHRVGQAVHVFADRRLHPAGWSAALGGPRRACAGHVLPFVLCDNGIATFNQDAICAVNDAAGYAAAAVLPGAASSPDSRCHRFDSDCSVNTSPTVWVPRTRLPTARRNAACSSLRRARSVYVSAARLHSTRVMLRSGLRECSSPTVNRASSQRVIASSSPPSWSENAAANARRPATARLWPRSDASIFAMVVRSRVSACWSSHALSSSGWSRRKSVQIFDARV